MATTNDDLSKMLTDAIAGIVEDLNVELIDVQVKGPRNKRIVKLVGDAMDTDDGLDIDRIAQVSHAVGDTCDELIPGSYTLEVSSPGIDRPLTSPRHFTRNVGRDVEVRHANGATDTQTTGTIDDVDDTMLTLDTASGHVQIPFDEIFEGRIKLPW